MKFSLAACMLIAVAQAAAPQAAAAQTLTPNQTSSPTITQLLTNGFDLKAASSNGAQQFLYLQGTDTQGKKKIYACQLVFGAGGGFQGCLALP